MVTIIRKKIFNFYATVISSIALYPTIIAFGLFLLALYLVNTDNISVAEWIQKHARFLAISDADAARTVLATIIGGVISLTVFSFSMVMLTLNQASTNFSHRILPGLISEKNNQIVLGVYLGTAVYSLIVLLSIRSDSSKSSVFLLSVLIAMILFINCLALFIYFINSISTNVQIDNIMNDLYTTCNSDMVELAKQDEILKRGMSSIAKTTVVRSKVSGWYFGIVRDQILKDCQDHKMNLYIKPYIGQFITEGQEIFHFDHTMDTSFVKKIHDSMTITEKFLGQDSYRSGFELLTEIGLKAMSPGINDPATALVTLEYLSDLFAKRAKIANHDIQHTHDKQFVVITNRKSFEELLNDTISQYRLYCKDNVVVMNKIKALLDRLPKVECHQASYLTCINSQVEATKYDIDQYIKNPYDLKEQD